MTNSFSNKLVKYLAKTVVKLQKWTSVLFSIFLTNTYLFCKFNCVI